MQRFELTHCTVFFYDGWAWTAFRKTGEGWGAIPGHDSTYHNLAKRLGYGGDIVRYCLEHDFLHSFIEQEVFNRPSPILWNLAHGRDPPENTVYEEALVQMFQGFLRSNWEMTAVGPGIDWWAIREKAWLLLGRDLDEGASQRG